MLGTTNRNLMISSLMGFFLPNKSEKAFALISRKLKTFNQLSNVQEVGHN